MKRSFLAPVLAFSVITAACGGSKPADTAAPQAAVQVTEEGVYKLDEQFYLITIENNTKVTYLKKLKDVADANANRGTKPIRTLDPNSDVGRIVTNYLQGKQTTEATPASSP